MTITPVECAARSLLQGAMNTGCRGRGGGRQGEAVVLLGGAGIVEVRVRCNIHNAVRLVHRYVVVCLISKEMAIFRNDASVSIRVVHF